MSEDLIRYDVLVQEALRSVVRRVLQEVSRTDLPGKHHFFIQFDTNAPGVRISSRLKEEYPDEMTVVIQHQFWDMDVTDQGFEVGLSFGGIPEKLAIPFAAIKGFFDPSVQFGLQFEPEENSPAVSADLAAAAADAERIADGLGQLIGNKDQDTNADGSISSAPSVSGALPAPPAAPEGSGDDADESEQTGSADVVSLDSFRKRS